MGLDIKKSGWKIGQSLMLVMITGAMSVYYDQIALMGLIPVVEGVKNILKHSDSFKSLLISLDELLEE